MAAAVETEAQKYIQEHGPAPRAVPELDEALWLAVGTEVTKQVIRQHAAANHDAPLAPWQLARIMGSMRLHHAGPARRIGPQRSPPALAAEGSLPQSGTKLDEFLVLVGRCYGVAGLAHGVDFATGNALPAAAGLGPLGWPRQPLQARLLAPRPAACRRSLKGRPRPERPAQPAQPGRPDSLKGDRCFLDHRQTGPSPSARGRIQQAKAHKTRRYHHSQAGKEPAAKMDCRLPSTHSPQ